MNEVENWLEAFKSDSSKNIKPPLVNNSKGNRAITVAVSSGKGGVGKTTIALKMALELSKMNKKVLLVDCDYNLSNTLVKLGLPLNNNFYQLVAMQKDFDECLFKDKNFHLLAGCNGNLDLFEKKFEFDKLIIDVIEDKIECYDYIFLDCPAGVSEHTLNLNAYTDHRIVIINPDKSSITDSYSLIKLLKLRYDTIVDYLVINRIISKFQYKKVAQTMINTSSQFLNIRPSVLGGIQEYDNRLESFDHNLFNSEQSLIHKNFLKIVQKYSETTKEEKKKTFHIFSSKGKGDAPLKVSPRI